MNAQTFPHFSRAITEQVIERSATPLEDYARQLRADAEQIGRDVRAGRLIPTEHGYFTRDQLDSAIRSDVGITFPNKTNEVAK